MKKNNYLYFIIMLMLFVVLGSLSDLSAEGKRASFQNCLEIIDSSIDFSNKDKNTSVTCIGKIKNRSMINWTEIVIEVQYFNSEGKLIDTMTESNYDQIVASGDEVAFRVNGLTVKSTEQYAKHTAKLTWAKEIFMETERNSKLYLLKIFESWLPLIILIGVWVFFISKMRKPQKESLEVMIQYKEYLKIQNELFTRLVNSVEKIQKKYE